MSSTLTAPTLPPSAGPPVSGPAVRIGPYRMSKTLGIGSFGKVKRA